MNYYVIWPDGKKFGPADVPTLAQWQREGRINEETSLEEVDTGRTLNLGELGDIQMSWSEPAPQPPALSESERLVQEAVSQDKPVDDSNFEIPQEFATSSSPYPVESYYKPGKSELSTAWSLIIGGFFLPVIGICCSFAALAGPALVGTGIYYADKAIKGGEEGGRAAKITGIVILCLQILVFLAYIVFIAVVMASSFSGSGRRFP